MATTLPVHRHNSFDMMDNQLKEDTDALWALPDLEEDKEDKEEEEEEEK